MGLLEKTLPRTDANANYKMLNLGCVFHHLRRLPWTSGPVQILETLKSNWLGREVTDIKADCFYSRCQIKTSHSNQTRNSLFSIFLNFSTSLGKDNVTTCTSQAIVNKLPQIPLRSHRVQLLRPEHPVPCFYSSLIITILAKVDTNAYANCSIFVPMFL